MVMDLVAARHCFEVVERLRDEGKLNSTAAIDSLVQTVQHLLWHLEAKERRIETTPTKAVYRGGFVLPSDEGR